jgi:TetR/AcrR family transcriptional regulator, transcriptional repressor for nem operon
VDQERTTRTKPTAERRTDLLDAGLEVFAERGYAKTTIAEIVERAGVAQGTFYLHFATKEALLFALQERFKERMVARAAAAITASGADWSAKLDALVLVCFEDYTRQADQHDVLFAHLSRDAKRRGEGRPKGRGLIGVITTLLAEGKAADAYVVDDVEVTGVLLYSALHSGIDEVVHLGEPETAGRLVPALQDLFRRAAGCA